ncbi:hypothetical protein Arno162_8 [Pectobacterium phage Arno162]|uniref:Uncharacterized protein n=1 Tax=Pectobacterium phage Arno162 TaxID=2500577 RepID=A0A678ZJH1_9CAUD|nr:hypothetical protein Arno162_8 [Pectobacterium phage Arno162]
MYTLVMLVGYAFGNVITSVVVPDLSLKDCEKTAQVIKDSQTSVFSSQCVEQMWVAK